MPNYFTKHKNLPFLGQSLQIFFCSGSLPNRRHFYPHLYSSFRFKVLNMNLDVTQDTIKNHVSVFKLENLNKSVAFRFQISTMTKIYFYIDFIIQKPQDWIELAFIHVWRFLTKIYYYFHFAFLGFCFRVVKLAHDIKIIIITNFFG